MRIALSRFIDSAKKVLTEVGHESFIESQRRHVFYYFLVLMYSSFLLYMLVVAPSTWYFGAINAVFWMVEVLFTMAFLSGILSLKKAFAFMLIAIQLEICCENVICAFHMVDYPRLLIMANMLLSFMFIMVAACAYLDRISLILGTLSLSSFAVSAYVTHGPFLLRYIILVLILLLFASLLGHMIYINAKRLQNENKILRTEEREVLRFLQISRKELFSIIELSSKENSEEQTRLLIENLGPKAKENLFAAFQANVQAERTQLDVLKQVFPEFSPTEQTICRLVLQDKTIGEICDALFKSSGTITSQRARIRSKLGLQRDDNLKEALQKRIEEWERHQKYTSNESLNMQNE